MNMKRSDLQVIFYNLMVNVIDDDDELSVFVKYYQFEEIYVSQGYIVIHDCD